MKGLSARAMASSNASTTPLHLFSRFSFSATGRSTMIKSTRAYGLTSTSFPAPPISCQCPFRAA